MGTSDIKGISPVNARVIAKIRAQTQTELRLIEPLNYFETQGSAVAQW